MRSNVVRGARPGVKLVGAAVAGVFIAIAALSGGLGGCANDGSGNDGAHIRHGWMTESD